MDGGAGYGGLQQPAGAYAGAGAAGDASPSYNASQTSPSPYGQTSGTVSTTTSGLGNGVNLQPSYYHSGNVDLGWNLMKRAVNGVPLYPKIKSVRIEIELGQEVNAERWIKEAVDNKYTVIATFHKGAMLTKNQEHMDDPNELLTAAEWWAAYYPTLTNSGPFTINLMNEWGSHGIAAHDFAATYNKAIATVRSVYNGHIIVDIPGFGQEAHTAALAIAEITDHKIILSAHIYSQAWNLSRNREMTTADIDELHSTGLGCMVGEFGNDALGGKTPWEDLVIHAKSKGWPVFGWAWNGDDTKGGIMNMIQPQFQAPAAAKSNPYTPKTPYFNTIYDLL